MQKGCNRIHKYICLLTILLSLVVLMTSFHHHHDSDSLKSNDSCPICEVQQNLDNIDKVKLFLVMASILITFISPNPILVCASFYPLPSVQDRSPPQFIALF